MRSLITLLMFLAINTQALIQKEFKNSKAKVDFSSIEYLDSLNKTNRSGASRISGTLSTLETGEPIDDSARLSVSLIGRIDENSQWESFGSEVIIDSQYDFSNLDSGQYYLFVQSAFQLDQEDRPVYVNKLWNVNDESIYPLDQITSEFIINLADNETRPDIDFTMEPAGIFIALFESNSSSLAENLIIIDQDNQFFYSSTVINSIFVGPGFTVQKYFYQYLPVGNYRFYIETDKKSFYQGGELERVTNFIYGSGECYECELELLAGKGSEVTIEKFERKIIEPILNIGASISGKIHTELNSEEKEGFVSVYNMHGRLVAATSTCNPSTQECSPEGEYTVSGLVAGQYFMSFKANDHVRKQYGGLDCPLYHCDIENSIPIRLLQNQQLQIQDVHLQKSVQITGFMTDSETGQALEVDNSLFNGSTTNLLEVYDEGLNFKAFGFNQGDDGFRVDSQLKPGKYYLRTGSSINGRSNENYINQAYDGIECEGNNCDFKDALLIDLTINTSVDDIHISLHKGHSISGTIQDSDNNGIMNVEVVALNLAGDIVSSTRTKYSGSYQLKGLKSGEYYIRTYNGNKQNYANDFNEIIPSTSAWINQLFPHSVCTNNTCGFLESNKIQIESVDITDIDFILSKGVKINGSVKNSSRGTGVENIEIKIFDEQGNYLESYFTDRFGDFSTAALQAGTYRLVTSNHLNYVNQSYGGVNCGLAECDPMNSTLMTIENTNIDGVNFNLLPGEDYYPALSGLWYTEAQSGHGFQFEVIEVEGKASLYASWYVMKDGESMWLTGIGQLNKDKAFIEVYITSGGQFPPDFDPDDVELSHWGRLTINFNDLDSAEINWQTDYQGFENGGLSIQRITNLSTSVKEDNTIDACMSGTFFNPDQSGYGVMIEVLGPNASNVVLTWYAYHEGQQFWLLANGPIDGNSANNLTALYTSGSDFPPNFIAEDINTNIWGEFNLQKIDNNNIRFEWLPNMEYSDFGTGSIDFTRLTKIGNLEGCVY